MSTEAPSSGLAFWIPQLVSALDRDVAGAGAQLRSIVAGRTARIGVDDDVVLVESVADGALSLRNDDPSAPADGSGLTTRRAVVALLNAEVEVNQIVVNGDLELHSPIDDALWMYQVIELLLDGASRVPELRDLAAQFVGDQGAAASTPLAPDWHAGSRQSEVDLLARLGLLEERTVDDDG